jgi:hypothetical protein
VAEVAVTTLLCFVGATTPKTTCPANLLVGIFGAAVLVFYLVRFRVVGVYVDDEQVTVRSMVRTRSMRWADLEHLSTAFGFVIVPYESSSMLAFTRRDGGRPLRIRFVTARGRAARRVAAAAAEHGVDLDPKLSGVL